MCFFQAGSNAIQRAVINQAADSLAVAQLCVSAAIGIQVAKAGSGGHRVSRSIVHTVGNDQKIIGVLIKMLVRFRKQRQ